MIIATFLLLHNIIRAILCQSYCSLRKTLKEIGIQPTILTSYINYESLSSNIH